MLLGVRPSTNITLVFQYLYIYIVHIHFFFFWRGSFRSSASSIHFHWFSYTPKSQFQTSFGKHFSLFHAMSKANIWNFSFFLRIQRVDLLLLISFFFWTNTYTENRKRWWENQIATSSRTFFHTHTHKFATKSSKRMPCIMAAFSLKRMTNCRVLHTFHEYCSL